MTAERRRSFELLFLLLVCFGMARFTFNTFGPSSLRIAGGFNSDAAIPVIMANENRVTPFHLYYFGQDRWGGWPFLIMSALHRLFGWVWTPERVSMIQTSVFLLGALAIQSLSPAFGSLWAVVFLVTACLDPLIAGYVFSLANPYAWHVPLLLGSWVAIRRLMRTLGFLEDQGPRFAWRAAGGVLGVGILAVLAQWTWTLSAPLLWIIVLLESLLMGWTSGLRIWAAAVPAALIGIAMKIELIGRRFYHGNATSQFGNPFQSPLELDAPHWKENLSAIWRNLTATGWSWWGIVSAAGLLISIGLAARIFSSERVEGRRSPRRTELLESLVFAAGSAVIGAAVVGANVAANWPRLNGYNHRYLTVAHLFWPVGAAAGLTSIFSNLPLRPRVRSRIIGAITAAVLLFFVALRPAPLPDPEYADKVRAARELGTMKPGALLLGGYWGTYVFAGLAGPGLVTPLPFTGECVRIPWFEDRIETVDSVVVSHFGTQRFRSATGPIDTFIEYGQRFSLSDPRWVSHGPFEFSLYSRVGSVYPVHHLPREPSPTDVSYGKGPFQAEYQLIERPSRVCAGGTASFVIQVVNRSPAPWRTRRSAIFLSYHWLTGGAGTSLVFDGRRTALPSMLDPDETAQIPLSVEAPAEAGNHALVVDLVQEGVTWFSEKGCPPLRIPVRVSVCTAPR